MGRTPDPIGDSLELPEIGLDPVLVGEISLNAGAIKARDVLGTFNLRSGGSGITEGQHETLRQLIHFIDDGPGAGFLAGAVKITGYSGALVTSEVWYEDGTLTGRYVDLAVSYSGALPSVEVWRIYATDGVTITATLTDVIAYAGALEIQRTRTWI
jgi:hypothetical protein